jgi:hypothetical protein
LAERHESNETSATPRAVVLALLHLAVSADMTDLIMPAIRTLVYAAELLAGIRWALFPTFFTLAMLAASSGVLKYLLPS